MSKLSQGGRDRLLDVFERISSEQFPSLVEKLARLAEVEQLSEPQYQLVQDTFGSELTDNIGAGFQPARELDIAVHSILEGEEANHEDVLEGLYPRLLMELTELREMMD